MEVVTADHHEDVGICSCQRLAERLDLGDPLVGEGRPVRSGRGASPEIKRMMLRCDDRRHLGHSAPRVSYLSATRTLVRTRSLVVPGFGCQAAGSAPEASQPGVHWTEFETISTSR